MNIFATVVLVAFMAACSTTAAVPDERPAPTPPQAIEYQGKNQALAQALQFLLAAASSDFHAHRPPGALAFSDVRVGHIQSPEGGAQYMFCGQMLSTPETGKTEQLTFITIRTSGGYEHMIGAQAEGLCRRNSIVWDAVGDLSSDLQSRLDSL